MTNKEAYTKVSAEVIALLAKADELMMNSSSQFDPHAEDAIEYEYFIQKQKFHGAVQSALLANCQIRQLEDFSTEFIPLTFD